MHYVKIFAEKKYGSKTFIQDCSDLIEAAEICKKLLQDGWYMVYTECRDWHILE